MKIFQLILLFLPFHLIAQNNVGIGTTTPQSRLDIEALGDGAEILRLSSDRPWVFKQRFTGPSTRLTLQTTVDTKTFDILSEDGLHRSAEFFTGNAYSRVMLVPDGGEVGIGVNDATGKLHVQHNSTTAFPQIRITEDDDDYGRLKFESSVNPGAFWDIAAKADTLTNDSKLNFFFFNSTNSGDRMTITGIGNVGIGTTNPSRRLHVFGSPAFTGNVFRVESTYSGNSNLNSLEAIALPADGYGVAGYFDGGWRGVRAYAHGNGSTGHSIAVEASAYGSAGTRTGVFGRAVGGTVNWAGYFSEGNVYVTNELRIGSGAIGGASGYKVAIDGKVIAEELRVQLSGAWPDYVFSEDYALPAISEVASYVQLENHLPGIPSAKEIESDGLHLGEMQRKMVEKIEELMLYIIQQEERISQLEEAIKSKQ